MWPSSFFVFCMKTVEIKSVIDNKRQRNNGKKANDQYKQATIKLSPKRIIGKNAVSINIQRKYGTFDCFRVRFSLWHHIPSWMCTKKLFYESKSFNLKNNNNNSLMILTSCACYFSFSALSSDNIFVILSLWYQNRIELFSILILCLVVVLRWR